jgi:hypothetical protein
LKIVSLPFIMQRFAAAALALLPRLLAGQEAAGTQLWRLTAATIPTPTALVTGGTAGWWNPAQTDGGTLVALELVQTPPTIGASGFIAAVRARLSATHRVGLAYGRMGIDDLVSTTLSPEPSGEGIDYYTQTARALWSADVAGTTLGAALSYTQTRLDVDQREGLTLDFGFRGNFGDRLVLAASTHFLGHAAGDASQDIYAATQLRLWRGELWTGSGPALVHARYGIVFGNEFAVDHQIGAGLDVAGTFTADVLIVAEGGYGVTNWRPVAGVQFRIGRYRVVFAGDAGPRQLGAAYRVGLETRLSR